MARKVLFHQTGSIRPTPWLSLSPVFAYFVIGFCAGAVAKFALHTRPGTLQTILLGIVGSVLGGVLGGD